MQNDDLFLCQYLSQRNREKANKNFINAKNKLHEGRGNIVGKIESIKKLGAKAEKTLPKKIVEKSEDFLELME